jgi:hypothetical protein
VALCYVFALQVFAATITTALAVSRGSGPGFDFIICHGAGTDKPSGDAGNLAKYSVCPVHDHGFVRIATRSALDLHSSDGSRWRRPAYRHSRRCQDVRGTRWPGARASSFSCEQLIRHAARLGLAAPFHAEIERLDRSPSTSRAIVRAAAEIWRALA